MTKTELYKWCASESSNYKHMHVERSGLPSPAKYKATLLALFSKKMISLEDIAKEVGTTYGTLRVWRSEKNFKKQVKENIERFSKFYISRAKQSIKGGKRLELYPGNEVITPSKKRIALAKELSFYSHELQKTIIFTLADDSMKSLIIMTTERTLREMGDLKTVHILNLIRIAGLHSTQELFLKSMENLLEAGMSVDSYIKTAINTSKGISKRLELALEEAENL